MFKISILFSNSYIMSSFLGLKQRACTTDKAAAASNAQSPDTKDEETISTETPSPLIAGRLALHANPTVSY